MMNRVAAGLAAAALGLTLGTAPAAASPPVTDFSVSPAVPTVGDTMTLDATGSIADPGGTAFRYEWDINDDGVYDLEGARKEDVGVLRGPDPRLRTVVLKVSDPAFPGDEPTIITKTIAVDNKPTAKISWSPGGALRSTDTATFTDDSVDLDGDSETGKIVARTWKVDGEDKGSGRTLTHEFETPGEHTITLIVRDARGYEDDAVEKVMVRSPPVPKFTFAPAEPTVGQEVELDARESFDPDTSDISYAWDVDGDGEFDDGSDPSSRTETTTFSSPGDHIVRLRVSDGVYSETTERTITVRAKPNAVPTPSFTVAPADPFVGQAVTFASTSSDADGRIVKYLWDVNNDGQFVEGGAVLSTIFSRAGAHTVALRVVDDAGGTATAFKTVTVRAPQTVTPPPPPPPGKGGNPTTTPRVLNPFPIVRMRGLILRRGVNVQILSVRAPRGSIVTVRCKGRGCPTKRVRVKLKRSAVRIHKLERRLRVGTVIEVRVTKKNHIGKYTKFVVRRNAAPQRRDLCLGPTSSRPVRCAA